MREDWAPNINEEEKDNSSEDSKKSEVEISKIRLNSPQLARGFFRNLYETAENFLAYADSPDLKPLCYDKLVYDAWKYTRKVVSVYNSSIDAGFFSEEEFEAMGDSIARLVGKFEHREGRCLTEECERYIIDSEPLLKILKNPSLKGEHALCLGEIEKLLKCGKEKVQKLRKHSERSRNIGELCDDFDFRMKDVEVQLSQNPIYALKKAVEMEEYELAAVLRDEVQREYGGRKNG